MDGWTDLRLGSFAGLNATKGKRLTPHREWYVVITIAGHVVLLVWPQFDHFVFQLKNLQWLLGFCLNPWIGRQRQGCPIKSVPTPPFYCCPVSFSYPNGFPLCFRSGSSLPQCPNSSQLREHYGAFKGPDLVTLPLTKPPWPLSPEKNPSLSEYFFWYHLIRAYTDCLLPYFFSVRRVLFLQLHFLNFFSTCATFIFSSIWGLIVSI